MSNYTQAILKSPLSVPNATTNQPINPPPPAYTFHSMPRALHLTPTTASSVSTAFEEVYSSEDSPLSPLKITITAPITVHGSNNLIALSPAQSTAKIAHSIVEALQGASMCRVGIPMIDEEGRPRPIDVVVDAPVRIEGDRNVVGEKAVLAVMMGGGLRRRREHMGTADELDMRSRKKRAASEPIAGN